MEALLGEGGWETAQRFVNIEDDCLRVVGRHRRDGVARPFHDDAVEARAVRGAAASWSQVCATYNLGHPEPSVKLQMGWNSSTIGSVRVIAPVWPHLRARPEKCFVDGTPAFLDRPAPEKQPAPQLILRRRRSAVGFMKIVSHATGRHV